MIYRGYADKLHLGFDILIYMSDIEIRFMSSDDMGEELRRLAEAMAKDKYSFEMKLKDVDLIYIKSA